MFFFLEKYLNNYFRELFDVTLRLLVNLTNPELLLFKVFSNIKFRGVYFLKIIISQVGVYFFYLEDGSLAMFARSGKTNRVIFDSQNKGGGGKLNF